MTGQGIAIAFFATLALPIGAAAVSGWDAFVTAWLVISVGWLAVALAVIGAIALGLT